MFLKKTTRHYDTIRITIAHRRAVVPKARPTRSMFGLEGSGLVAVKAFLLTTGERRKKGGEKQTSNVSQCHSLMKHRQKRQDGEILQQSSNVQ